jgi:hypothetical protein
MLVLGFLLASAAVPLDKAQARDLFGSMVGALTSPIRGVLGAGQHYRSRAHHRRIVRSPRSRPAATVAVPAAVGAAATAATVTGATAAAAEPKITGTTGSATSGELQTVLPPARAGRLGAVGPLAWPGSFEDVIGYTLWPKQYGIRLGAHGIGDVLSTALAPSAAIAAHTRQARADNSAADTTPACGSVELTANDWPIAEIGSTVELNDTQRAALDKVRTAMNGAIASIKSSCRDTADLGPVQRLQAMQSTLWMVHDAAQQMRMPLAAFYATLNDEQKQRFTAPERPSSARNPNRGDIARMCDLPASTDAPIRQIEQAVRPTAAQRRSLEELQRKAGEMGQFLLASCLARVPDTPIQRLDAAADRLTAMVFAISNVNIALNDFTRRLSDDQKSKLDSVAR